MTICMRINCLMRTKALSLILYTVGYHNMRELVIMKNNIPFTNTLVISEGIGIEHRAVISLLKKHSNTRTLSTFEMSKLSTKGRPIEVAYLSELQATFLISLMNNSERVIEFKERLTIAFFRQRQMLQDLLVQKNNAEWLAKRHETKQMRLEETDMIKKFVNYATEQGSKSAHHYYSNISRMETKALFFVEQKYPNMRDVMNLKQLNLIEAADYAVMVALEEGMDQSLNYKDIYLKAKNKIELLASIFPKSPLPLLLANAAT